MQRRKEQLERELGEAKDALAGIKTNLADTAMQELVLSHQIQMGQAALEGRAHSIPEEEIERLRQQASGGASAASALPIAARQVGSSKPNPTAATPSTNAEEDESDDDEAMQLDLDPAEVQDKRARKVIKRLKQRLLELEESAAGYEKQERKLDKKLTKLEAALQQTQLQVKAARKQRKVERLRQPSLEITDNSAEIAAEVAKCQALENENQALRDALTALGAASDSPVLLEVEKLFAKYSKRLANGKVETEKLALEIQQQEDSVATERAGSDSVDATVRGLTEMVHSLQQELSLREKSIAEEETSLRSTLADMVRRIEVEKNRCQQLQNEFTALTAK
jgi:hypothetical protein